MFARPIHASSSLSPTQNILDQQPRNTSEGLSNKNTGRYPWLTDHLEHT